MRARLAVTMLALGVAACGQRSPPPSAPPPRIEDAPPPAGWAAARIGDRVEYSFAGGEPREPGAPPAIAGTLTLELAALDASSAEIVATVRGSDPAAVARSFIIPVDLRTAIEHDDDWKLQGRTETLTVAGGSVRCQGWLEIASSGQTKRSDCDAPPLYLLGGVARWQVNRHGHGAHVGPYALNLTAIHRGSGATSTSAAGLPTLFAQGGWYRSLADREAPGGLASPEGWIDVVHTTGVRGGVLTERFQLRREVRTPDDVGRPDLVPIDGRWFAPAPSGTSRTVKPLVLALVELMEHELEPPPRAHEGLPTTEVLLGGHMVAVRREAGEGPRDLWAADPWEPALAGLPYDVRVNALRTESVEARTKTRVTRAFVTRLLDWGAGPLPDEPLPSVAIEGLSANDVSRAIVAARARMHCADALPDRAGDGVFFTVSLTVRPDGSVAAASARPAPGGVAVPPSVQRCIAKELRKLRFAPHALEQPPWTLDVAF